jgi:hypothetical protein
LRILATKTTYPKSRTVNLEKHEHLDLTDAIKRIINLNCRLANFWGDGAFGWAPKEVSDLLSKARMDRMVSFSYRLNDVLRPVEAQESEAQLIASWVTLGSLIEGSLALFFTIWRNDYFKNGPKLDKKGKALEPHKLTFDELKSFMLKNKLIDKKSHDWIEKVQQYRNVIHFFRDKKIGLQEELFSSIKSYLAFLEFINDAVPYPDKYARGNMYE